MRMCMQIAFLSKGAWRLDFAYGVSKHKVISFLKSDAALQPCLDATCWQTLCYVNC